MIYETINLSDEYKNATLTTYVFDDVPDMTPPPRRAVIVCPGGGYGFLSEREAEPIVSRFFGAGFNVFLLRYSIAPEKLGYEPLTEAGRAIAHIRNNAERYHIQPDKIFIVGFSAGGHLAASSGILWDCHEMQKEFCGQSKGINRPDGMILCYPVITAGEFTHRGSIQNLSGVKDYGDDIVNEWSLEKHVKETTPPAFIWHTFADGAVPVQNSLLLADAMTKSKVPFELHIYPEGPHGLSLGIEETANGNPEYKLPHIKGWIQLAIDWVNEQ